MKRRGPPSLKKVKRDDLHASPDRQDPGSGHETGNTTDSPSSSTAEAISSRPISRNAIQRADIARPSPRSGISGLPRTLEAVEVSFLDHYIQRFSREYPTCSAPSNPFLSVLLPLAMRSDVVLSSLLALSGAQRWGQHSSAFRRESLRLRHDALRGCRALLEQNDMLKHGQERAGQVSTLKGTSQPLVGPRQLSHAEAEKLVFVLTSSVLFLLWEKITGESTWKAHLEFISHFFNGFLPHLRSYLSTSVEGADAVRFCHHIFVYNDLVQATSTGSSLLSNFYLADVEGESSIPSGSSNHALSELMRSHAGGSRSLYYFPSLIARLCAGDRTVTVEEINRWDGNVHWLPSYSLYTGQGNPQSQMSEGTTVETSTSDRDILSELYRTACLIYRLQFLQKADNNKADKSDIDDRAQSLEELTQQAYGLMRALPSGSPFENAMLWPMGIFGRELTLKQSYERSAVLSRLHDLENRFHMRHFGRARDFLTRQWSLRDGGNVVESEGSSSEVDSVLMG